MPQYSEQIEAHGSARESSRNHHGRTSRRSVAGSSFAAQNAALSPQAHVHNADANAIFSSGAHDPALWAKVSEVAAVQTQKIAERVAFETQRLHEAAAREKSAINELASAEMARANSMQSATGSGSDVASLIQQQVAKSCATLDQHLGAAVGKMGQLRGALHAPQRLGNPNFAMQTVARAGLDVRQEVANCGLMARAEIEFDGHGAREKMSKLGNQAQQHLSHANDPGKNGETLNFDDDEYADQPWRRPSRTAQIAQFERNRLKNEFGANVPALGADAESDLTRVLWFDQMVRDKKIDPTMAEEMLQLGSPSTGAYFSQVAMQTQAKKKQRKRRFRNLIGSAIIGAVTGGVGSAIMAAATTSGSVLTAAHAALSSYSFTQAAFTSAISTWAIKYTGAGRKLADKVSHEIFDDVLGLDPETARLVGGFAMSVAGGKLISAGISSLSGPGAAPKGDVSVKSLQNNSIFTGESYQVASNGTVPVSATQQCIANVSNAMNHNGFNPTTFFPEQVRAHIKKCIFDPKTGRVQAWLNKNVKIKMNGGSGEPLKLLFKKEFEMTLTNGAMTDIKGLFKDDFIDKDIFWIKAHGNNKFSAEGGLAGQTRVVEFEAN